MELTQEQVDQIVEVAELYQIEMETAAKRFRLRLQQAGLPMSRLAGRLIERERYYRPEPAKMPRFTMDEDEKGH